MGTGVRTTVGPYGRTGAGEGERREIGAGDRKGTDVRLTIGTGVGAGTETVERTDAGRTGAAIVDGTTAGAGATVVGATTGGEIVTVCITASSFTITGVPTGAALKNTSAIP